MIGSTFASFQVLEKIGQGGTADIYVVNDQNGQRYTLRILRAEHQYSWRRFWRFRQECTLLELFDHPSIVHGYGHGKFRGQRYSIREYVEGGNLKDRILRSDPNVQVHRVKILTGMAAGLAHIHQHGYMHLDFKPENILLTRDYDPKIVDLELATRRPDRPKHIGKMPGTPAYLAPEQIAGQPIDERVDIFAYGVTAYEMLTGRKPVTGNTFQEVLQKYANFDEHLKPLHTYVPNIPQSIERVVLKCLEKDPDRRYPAISLVVRDLQS